MAAYETQLANRDETIRIRGLKIQALALELAYDRRICFANKSEHFCPEQGDLFQETWETDLAAIQAEGEALAPAAPPKKRPHAGRQSLPKQLERIERLHEPDSCTCEQCGRDLVKVREDITEQLDVEPARFFVHRHITLRLCLSRL